MSYWYIPIIRNVPHLGNVNSYLRYCDVFQRCREVDPSGPLATLRKLLLSDESIAGFKRWVLRHWYAVLLILIAVIALLVSTY